LTDPASVSTVTRFSSAIVDVYAAPRTVTRLEECWFYHTMDLPGYGTVQGEWDLRAGVREYLGGVDLRDKRVLEVGTASGFLCFTMEQQGARVVAVELAPGKAHDFIPHARAGNRARFLRETQHGLDRMRNSYWLGHRALRSRARVHYGSAYALPAALGLFDVSTFGCVLMHLRDPFLALANALRLTRETVILTLALNRQSWEPAVMQRGLLTRVRLTARRWAKRLLGYGPPPPHADAIPCMVFLPPSQPDNTDTWWFFTPSVLQQFLDVLGFEDSRVTYHQQMYHGRPHAMYTIVGQRTQPLPGRIDGPYPWW
jgi:hypothetical protein